MRDTTRIARAITDRHGDGAPGREEWDDAAGGAFGHRLPMPLHPPEPTPEELVVRATHVEAPSQDAFDAGEEFAGHEPGAAEDSAATDDEHTYEEEADTPGQDHHEEGEEALGPARPASSSPPRPRAGCATAPPRIQASSGSCPPPESSSRAPPASRPAPTPPGRSRPPRG